MSTTNAEALLRKTLERIAGRKRFPEATYRLQFHSGFTFRDASAIVPYLHDLGVTHCYASPYFKAQPGSQHGYDITDHGALNPEIGTIEDYEAWINELHLRGMGQIFDMVPNHMGIAGNDNVWWNDVLENGASSPFAGYFDIAWQDSPRPELYNRVLLPVLGDSYGKSLESQQIRLAYAAGAFVIHYFDRCLPIAPRTYQAVLEHNVEELERLLGEDASPVHEYRSILTALSHLPDRNEVDPAKIVERQREKEVIKRRLAALTRECAEVRESIEKAVACFNGKAGDPLSFDLLDRLLDQQAYRLSHWRVAADEINYRRFFDINELAALSMEKPEVFAATHEFVLRLLSQGKIDGLRIDHPDGLYDPKQYLQRLQKHYVLACAREEFASDPEYLGQDWKQMEAQLLERLTDSVAGERAPLYVVVEKILGRTEALPVDWATDGSSGYDFLSTINNLFIDSSQEKAFNSLYRDWVGDEASFAEIVYQKKYQIVRDALSSELHLLGRQLDRLAQKNRWSRDFTQNSLRYVLREVIACFPVYRSYISDAGVEESDRKHVDIAVRRAIQRNPTTSRSLFRFVQDMLLLRYRDSAAEETRQEQRRFAGKFQQLTSPVMAKGVEDTSFYVFNRLVSLNEVGGDPSQFGASIEAVHRYNQTRQSNWPFALSPLSTHDTKRSEDVRARLNVLSEWPGEWQQCLKSWSGLNKEHRLLVDDETVPALNDEYLLYQTLLGAWPNESGSAEDRARFVERIQSYMVKALHEAKVHTSWINPNEAYDAAIRQFVSSILDEANNRPFLEELRGFHKKLNHFGLLNSLAQTLLKLTCPGAPDTYQGTECWDFSLVDPDNRRPVDFTRRQEILGQLDARLNASDVDQRALARELIANKDDGRVKLFVTALSLRLRRAHPGLFSSGEYIPVQATGSRKDHVFSFVRRRQGVSALIVVPRLMTPLVSCPDGLPLGPDAWGDTTLALPKLESPSRWRNIFTGSEPTGAASADQAFLSLAEALADFPIALLISQ